MPEWLLIVPVVVLIATAAGIAVTMERRRGDALARAGRELGLEFTREGDLLPHGLHRLPFFHGGTGRNFLRGAAAGGELLVFDYSTGARRDRGASSQRSHTVAAFRFRGLELPAFELGPAGVLARIAAALGARAIDFADHPEFSRRFTLSGADESAVRALFTPPVRQFLAGLERKRRREVEARGEWLVVYRTGDKVRPRALGAFVADATAAVARIAGR
jgi:hypothetical protein